MTIQVVEPPTVPELYFWALQVSFLDGPEVEGAAHLGLQWHPHHPGSTAVNWGGYRSGGGILEGSESALPSALDNPHTRDYPWRGGDPYRLRVYAESPGRWVGEVTDLAAGEVTGVRTLAGGGGLLGRVMVWSEVFARCDAPPVAVVWSAPEGLTRSGHQFRPEQYQTNYQTDSAGGCSNTDSRPLPHGVVQLTSVTRTNPTGTRLPAR